MHKLVPHHYLQIRRLYCSEDGGLKNSDPDLFELLPYPQKVFAGIISWVS